MASHATELGRLGQRAELGVAISDDGRADIVRLGPDFIRIHLPMLVRVSTDSDGGSAVLALHDKKHDSWPGWLRSGS